MSFPTRWPLVIAFTLIATLVIARTSLVQGGSDDPQPIEPTAALLKRIQALEDRVATLEKIPLAAQIPHGKNPAEVPRNWGSSQINGQTVYIVRLSTGGALRNRLPHPHADRIFYS